MNGDDQKPQKSFPLLIHTLLNLTEEFPPAPNEADDINQGEAGGHLHRDCALMVDWLVYMVGLRPQLFLDIPKEQIQQIASHQEHAGEYEVLTWLFEGLVRHCKKMHTQHQAQAVIRTKRILAKVIAGYQHPELAPDLPHQKRVLMLTPALQFYEQGRYIRAGRAPKNSRKEKKAAPATPQGQARKAERKKRLVRFLTDRSK